MTKTFQPGDRVQYIGKDYSYPTMTGVTGTVNLVGPLCVSVHLDLPHRTSYGPGSFILYCQGDELDYINEQSVENLTQRITELEAENEKLRNIIAAMVKLAETTLSTS